jgi:hypothetical protein
MTMAIQNISFFLANNRALINSCIFLWTTRKLSTLTAIVYSQYWNYIYDLHDYRQSAITTTSKSVHQTSNTTLDTERELYNDLQITLQFNEDVRT